MQRRREREEDRLRCASHECLRARDSSRVERTASVGEVHLASASLCMQAALGAAAVVLVLVPVAELAADRAGVLLLEHGHAAALVGRPLCREVVEEEDGLADDEEVARAEPADAVFGDLVHPRPCVTAFSFLAVPVGACASSCVVAPASPSLDSSPSMPCAMVVGSSSDAFWEKSPEPESPHSCSAFVTKTFLEPFPFPFCGVPDDLFAPMGAHWSR